jgi:hypothetical protein
MNKSSVDDTVGDIAFRSFERENGVIRAYSSSYVLASSIL